VNRTNALAAVLGLVMLAVGCNKDKSGGAEGPQTDAEKRQASDLKMIAMGYHMAMQDRTPPMDEQKLMERVTTDKPIDFKAYVIFWGVNLDEVADQKNTVLAYAQDVPNSGGMVAFVDGSVRRVSAEQFRSLPQPTSTKMADRAPDVSLTVKEFSTDFNKYEGKIVELKGVVTGFESSSDYTPPKSFNDRIELGSGEYGHFAFCVMVEPQPWAKYAKGQQVTVKGRRVSGTTGGGNPQLLECVVVNAGAATGVSTTAEALSKEAASGADAMTARLKGKSLVLTGTVVRQEGERSSYVIVLQGSGKGALTCKFEGSGRERTKQFKAGDTTKLYGELDRIKGGEVILEKCQLILE
jgi:prepilin-type processing-associated H-X9-DG protein